MAESTLTMTLDQLKIAAAVEMGCGSNPTVGGLTTEQAAIIGRIMPAALRRAYFPGVVQLPGKPPMTEFAWTWMRPVLNMALWPVQSPTSGATLTSDGATPAVLTAGGTSVFYESMVGRTITFYSNDGNDTVIGTGTIAVASTSSMTLASGQTVAAATYRWGMSAGDYRLPDDFGLLDGPVTLADSSDREIKHAGEWRIRQLRQMSSSATGRPEYLTILPIKAPGTSGQRFDLQVYPIPAQLYTASLPYVYLPELLTGSVIYHAGGMPYSEVFRAAVLAEVESQVFRRIGIRAQQYQDAVIAAAVHDLRSREQYHGPTAGGTPRTTRRSRGFSGYGL